MIASLQHDSTNFGSACSVRCYSISLSNSSVCHYCGRHCSEKCLIFTAVPY